MVWYGMVWYGSTIVCGFFEQQHGDAASGKNRVTSVIEGTLPKPSDSIVNSRIQYYYIEFDIELEGEFNIQYYYC